MTLPERSTDMAALALALVGEFSKVQEIVDGLVALYAEKRAPGLKRFLADQHWLDRIPDRQRARLVLDIAAELGTPGDLSMFADVFHQVKATRDAVAYTTRMEKVDDDTLRLSRGYWTVSATRPRNRLPSPASS